MQENYAAFAHQAKLMTSIHAPIPLDLKPAVTEAKLRGEEAGTELKEQEGETSIPPTQKPRRAHPASRRTIYKTPSEPPLHTSHGFAHPTPPMSDDMSEDEADPASASKENNPSLSPSPVALAPPSPRKTALGKRPLSVLSIPYPEEDADMMLIDQDSDADTPMTSNEQNISANTRSRTSSPLRKTPKLSQPCGGVNATGRFGDEMAIYEDVPQLPIVDPFRRLSGDGKENHVSAMRKGKHTFSPVKTSGSALSSANTQLPTPLSPLPTASKVPKKKSMGVHKRPMSKAKPRIGIRRL